MLPQALFDLPAAVSDADAHAHAGANLGVPTAYALDLSSLVGGKGVAYVNGFNVGR